MHVHVSFSLKTPLLIYFNFFPKIFSKIWVAKLGVRLICECGLYASVYGTQYLHFRFRFTLMHLALRVLFHQFQIIFDRIRLTFSVATGTKSTNAIKYSRSTVNIPQFRWSCSWTYKINKLLMSPNERFNDIILERTIKNQGRFPSDKTRWVSSVACG